MAKAGNQWTFVPQVDSEGRLVLAHLTVRVLRPYQFTDGRYLAAGKAKSRCLKILGTLRASQPSGLRSESEIRGSFFSPIRAIHRRTRGSKKGGQL